MQYFTISATNKQRAYLDQAYSWLQSRFGIKPYGGGCGPRGRYENDYRVRTKERRALIKKELRKKFPMLKWIGYT